MSLSQARAKREEEERLRALAARRRFLLGKYNDDEVVDRILRSDVWQGMSEEQLLDAMGPPADTAIRVYKSKTVQTFKYGQVGRNRYSTRITLEDGLVVGWDLK